MVGTSNLDDIDSADDPDYEPSDTETVAEERCQSWHGDKNETLLWYFNAQSEQTDNEYKQGHYNKVIKLLEDTEETIESIVDFEYLLCNEGGYANPKGLMAHYTKHVAQFNY